MAESILGAALLTIAVVLAQGDYATATAGDMDIPDRPKQLEKSA